MKINMRGLQKSIEEKKAKEKEEEIEKEIQKTGKFSFLFSNSLL